MSESKAHEHYCPIHHGFWSCYEDGCSARVIDLPCDDCLEEIDEEDAR